VSDANVVKLVQPGSFADPLTEVLRNGARAVLAQAVEAEVADFLAKHVDVKTATGLRRLVRHGHLPDSIELSYAEYSPAFQKTGAPCCGP
jgi:putative transposase